MTGARLLVTASRTWTHLPSIAYMVESIAMEEAVLGRDLTVVHGKAKNGGDMLVARFVQRRRASGFLNIDEEPHPADWYADCVPGRCTEGHRRVRRGETVDYCPAQGMYRNEVMVALLTPPGPGDQAVAFIRDKSPGATAAAKLAVDAGIHTMIIRWEDRHKYVGEVR